jgi:hypothetical protein
VNIRITSLSVWVLGGVVTMATASAIWATRKPSPAPPIPSMSGESQSVAQWVDRGLLRLAEQDVATASLHGGAGVGDPAFDELRVAPDASAPSDGPAAKRGDVDEPAYIEEDALGLQRARLYRRLSFEYGLNEDQLSAMRAIVDASPYFGEGNPRVSVHPMSREECQERRSLSPLVKDDAEICGAPNMVALFDAERQDPSQARICIDQFEFPNLPCEYPVVWVRANEAARICRIFDKRLCDAHEWEGACAGKLRAAGKEYESWATRQLAELIHNQGREWAWATGVKPDRRLCATGTLKSQGCVDASWDECGTNSYPTGAFPRCVSPFGVYDMHGNVAEHMNLPVLEEQLGSRGGSGETEMKGSWFAFDEYHPHPDDCRWRAPSWHATSVESPLSHFNYHLGFRCCKDLD